MSLRLIQIDAFATRPFTGNPAAVVPLNEWLPDATLQAIAMENNLSETAYFVPTPDGETDFHLRWFTPRVEVELCGHATLATAHALMAHLGWERDDVAFDSRSGTLRVERFEDMYTLDFPAHVGERVDAPAGFADAMGATPLEYYKAPHSLAVFESEVQVRALNPDFRALREIAPGYFIATAPGSNVDFVSRFFAPGAGIDEDPVTGSAHCTSTPYWVKRLGKPRLEARQLSERTGDLICEHDGGDRVRISGRARTFLVGSINLDV